jgi:hypothetical protein
MVDENTQAPESNEEAAAPEAAADLNLNDLAALRSIIDAASTRGAFKANEMVAVGTVYNKLDKFLTQAQEQAKAAPNA